MQDQFQCPRNYKIRDVVTDVFENEILILRKHFYVDLEYSFCLNFQ